MGLIEELASISTLRHAWEKVAGKRGAPGIDRVSIVEFADALDSHLEKLAHELITQSYRSLPVMRLRFGFLGAADRPLVVAAVRDRVVHRALSDLLSPKIDPVLSPACRAFRKGSSAQNAADDVGRWISGETPWVLRADIRKFFDAIQPAILLDMLAAFVDGDELRFLERLLRCRVFDRHQVSEMIVGIPQGSPLSPLLANLYLHQVDQALCEEYPRYIRYCDDSIILTAQEDEARGALDRMRELLAPLELELHPDKTRVCRAEDGFVFLGYHFGPAGRGPAVKAIEALETRLADFAEGELDLAELDAVYRGWVNYFGEHPTCWTTTPAGLLALLRAGGSRASTTPPGDDELSAWRRARLAQGSEISPQLAVELAGAWAAAGLMEQSWVELALACGGSRATTPTLERWARILDRTAESLAEITPRLVGPLEERLKVLSEAVTELGDYALGSRLASLAATDLPTPSEDDRPDRGDLAAIADLPLLEAFFQGRDGVHAVEAVNRAGQRSFLPVHRPLSSDDWLAHLRGEKTLALPLVRAGNSALVGVLDVDLERRFLDERLGVADELLGRALATALRLRQELERRGGAALLELSGYKGYHLWLRLREPVPCFRLRRFLLDVITAISPLPDGVRVEAFPNRDRVKGDQMGPVIKLPLGVHSRTGKRCPLLDERGQPLADPFLALRELPRLPAELIVDAGQPVMPRERADKPPELGPRARKMLDGCRVLAYLERRSRDTLYLNHRERTTLLCTLGHLGDDGKAALHTIIGHTYNYRSEVTDRHLERLPPYPMSCPKIRELHPEAAAFGVCECAFRLRGKGYPTPLLHVLKPSEIAAFRRQRSAKASKKMPQTKASSTPQESTASGPRQDAEEIVRKIAEMKKHRRGIDASIERLRQSLAEVFAAADQDQLQLSMGTLRRVEREGEDGVDFVIEV